ncbi:MAG: twin-arginine translocase TatA/TatE family subunit [Patescibacteria group bacterium]|jgi:TatA/E family protein of Tat protein translocase
MLGNFGIVELIIIALIIVLIFGGEKVSEFFKNISETVKGFRKPTKKKSKK